MDLTIVVNKYSVRFRPLTVVTSFLYSMCMHCYSHREKDECKRNTNIIQIYVSLFPIKHFSCYKCKSIVGMSY